MRTICFFIFTTLFLNVVYCNSTKTDSLMSALIELDEEHHAEIYNSLSHIYMDSAGNMAIDFANRAIYLAEKYNQPERLAYAYIMLGSAFLAKSNYRNALEVFYDAVPYSKDINSHRNLHTIYNNIGVIYRNVNQPEMALKSNKQALEHALITQDAESLLQTYNNIGNAYAITEDYPTALEYFMQAKKIGLSDPNLILELSSIYNNIGWISEMYEDYESALKYYKNAYHIFDSLNLNWGKVVLLNNLSGIYIKTNRLDLAEAKINEADSIHQISDLNQSRINLYYHAYNLYKSVNKYDYALEYLHKYYQLKDSVHSKELNEFIFDLQTKYEVDRFKSEAELNQLVLSRQRTVITALIIVLLSIIVFVAILTKLFRDKSIINIKLEEYNKEIIRKNQLINDNLNYAKQIQDACMVSKSISHASSFFVVNLPLSTVGGDFYMTREAHNSNYFILADCTGHGVSGGFLSVLAIQYVDVAISKYKNTGQIMDYLNSEFYNYFSDKANLAGESFCITILRFFDKKLYYSGSKMKFWIADKNANLKEYKTSSSEIGRSIKENFAEHEIIPSKESIIYLSSDGYPDQFGGESNKKMKYSKFRDILVETSKTEFENQKTHLQNRFSEWKSTNQQTDDALVLGIDASYFL